MSEKDNPEFDVEDPDVGEHWLRRGVEHTWAHFWFLLLLIIFTAGGYVVYRFIQAGAIDLDVTLQADVNLGLPLTLLVLAMVGMLILYTWRKYVVVSGAEHAESTLNKLSRGLMVAMDNFSADDYQRLREETGTEEEETEDET